MINTGRLPDCKSMYIVKGSKIQVHYLKLLNNTFKLLYAIKQKHALLENYIMQMVFQNIE